MTIIPVGMDESDPQIVARSGRLSLRQALSAAWERVLWRGRTDRWEQESSQGLVRVVDALLERCRTTPETLAIDLGCGSGAVTLPLAPRCAGVLAVDINAGAMEMLARKAAERQLTNVQTLTAPIQGLGVDPESLDLVVSNYALHHLGDADKREVLDAAIRWLKPGGQLVIGDMMFGRGSSGGDRQIIATKVRAMARKGPAGWWRIAKNVWRFALRLQEKPLPVATWERFVAQAGFEGIRTERIVQEACVLTAIRPGAGRPSPVPAAGQAAASA